MKPVSSHLVAGACVLVIAAVLAACGDGGRQADPVATAPAPVPAPAPAPVAAAPDPTVVPATASDSPAAFVAYVKSLSAGADDSSEPLSLPANAKDTGDDTAEPQAIGA